MHAEKLVKNNYRKILKKVFSLPKENSVRKSIKTFSPSEKILFAVLIAVFIGSTFSMLSSINNFFLVKTPTRGGTIIEGVVGSPRFINPLLASSDTDRDLTALVFSGLMKATPEGDLIKDLAESYSISEDGFIYDFVLRDEIVFHDGVSITADDIVFTIQKAQDSALKSPKRASWDGITVEKLSDKEVRFILKQPYAPFLENATIGILPKHIWKEADSEQFPFSQFNNEPVGSGPYKVKRIRRNSIGMPESYDLSAFNKYALGKPYISNIKIVFYPSENALLEGYRNKEVGGINSVSPERLQEFEKKGVRIEHSPLPRIFAVFFNQNQAPILANKEVRLALDTALDKRRIVEEVLSGYGTKIDGPIPSGLIKSRRPTVDNKPESDAVFTDPKERAQSILEDNGWTFNEEENVWKKKVKKESQELRFSLSTSNTPELKAAAEIIVEEWQSIGINVDLKIFEPGDINQNVIRPRKYHALLFGEIISRSLDLFAFWHSSQRNDPGLNIALYANITADKLLEDARTASDKEEMLEDYRKFEEEVYKDMPAVFVYSPDFIYIVPKNVKALRLGTVTIPAERFLNAHKWYINTNSVWNFFKN